MTKSPQSLAAYWITSARQSDYTIRAAITRSCAAVALVLAYALTTSAWWGWIILGLAFLGVYMSLANGLYEGREDPPGEWLARVALRSGKGTKGDFSANASGIVETTSALLLPLLPAWAMGDPWYPRLLALVGAAGYLASVTSAIFVDTTWFNPAARLPGLALRLRSAVAAGAAAIMAAEVMPASWASGQRGVVALVCGAVLLVQWRIRETDRLLTWVAPYSAAQRQEGRRDITDAAHTTVGGQMTALRRQLERHKEQDPQLWYALIQVDSAMRETLYMDRDPTSRSDWPGLLLGQLDQVSGQYAVPIVFDPPQKPFADQDRETARFVLHELALNAAKYGAAEISIQLRLEGDLYIADIHDDGPPFQPGSWQRPAGGLERVARHLANRHGSLAWDSTSGGKVVTATWRTAVREELSQEGS